VTAPVSGEPVSGGPDSAEPEHSGSAPRLDLIAPGELDDAQRALYEAITSGPRSGPGRAVPLTDELGRLMGPFAVMLLTPELGDAVQQVGARIRFATGLSGRQRELAILTVAGELRSDFERLAHVPVALRAGLTGAQLDAVLAGQQAEGLAAEEELTCRLARCMIREHGLSDDDYAAGTAGLGQTRLAELTWLVGYYSALALALAVFRPVLPESFTASGS
jgi:alkylhydroperoxidase family enzyme